MKYNQLFLGKFIAVFIAIPLFFIQCEKKGGEGLSEEKFAEPPINYRPLAFWDWLNGYVDTARMVYELEQMKDKGMQGAFIWDVGALMDPKDQVPAGPPFLGEKSLGYISLALDKASQLGLNLGMIASSSWNAGGGWIDKPHASKELLSSSQIVTGPSKKTIEIKVPRSQQGIPEVYSLIHTIAVPYSESKEIGYDSERTISLDQQTSEDRVIEWDVPEGKWEVISFFMANTGQHLAVPSPNSDGFMIDHLSRKATRVHFDTILAKLESISTKDNHLKFLEVDSYEVWPAKDWTPRFIKEFKTRYGYDPLPFMPLLAGYSSKDSIVGKRFLGDYRRLVSNMIIENHFAQASAMVNKNGMKLFAEGGHGGYPRVDPLKAMGNTDVPMGEFWNRQRFWVTREAASAAHIYGKKVVASESLTGWNHWQHGPTDYKQLCDIAFCAGLNQVFFHTFAHNPEMAGKPGFVYHAGEHINVNTTWWEMARPFMDYLSRCSYMLRQGNFVADACLYYGDQTPNLVPPDRIDPNIDPIYGEHQCLHCGRPKPVEPGDMTGYEYDHMNAEIIVRDMKVEDGKLVLPSGISYRVMQLPDKEDINLEVLRKVEKLVHDGAVIIGPKPIRTTSLKGYPECDREVKEIAEKVWGDCDGKNVLSHQYGQGKVYWGKSVKQVLAELDVQPDFTVKGTENSDQHIDHIHRQTETEDIYFISNSREEKQDITCVFRVDQSKTPEIWDAETGLIQREVDYKKTRNGISMDFVMDPLASRFVVFKNNSTGKNDEGLTYDLQYGFPQSAGKERVPKTIDITENWDICFNPEMGAPESYKLDKLTSWSEVDNKGVQYYSGKAKYSRDFSVSEEQLSDDTDAFVVFEDIQEMARVFVNGNDCGIVWTPPYKARITPYLKFGTNKITIEVINTWNNRIVGDMRNPKQEPFTQSNAKVKFSKDSPLLSSGLMGKAKIYFVNKY